MVCKISSLQLTDNPYIKAQVQQKKKLPDIVITISVSVTRSANLTTVSLNLITRNEIGKAKSEKLPNLESFLGNIEESIFRYIIKNYHD